MILLVEQMKDKTLYSDLINEFQLMLNKTHKFEEIIYEILKNSKMSEEDISTIFNFSIINNLEYLLFLFQNLL